MDEIRTRRDGGHSEEFRLLTADFSRGVLLEARAEADRHPFAPLGNDLYRRIAELGLFGINVPESVGGLGLPASALSPILEEMSIVDAGPAAAVFTNAAAMEIINSSEDGPCRSALGAALSSSPLKPIAFTPFHHPDEAVMPVTGDGKTLNGRAEFVTLAGISSLILLPARHPGNPEFGYYCVDPGHAGVRASAPLFTLGLRACPSCDLVLENVPAVSAGGPDRGRELYRRMARAMAPAAASLSLGIMRGSLRDAAAYAADRYQGGRFIDQWPEVRMILAGMIARIECARTALDGVLDGDLGEGAAALALTCGEDACRVTSDGVQVLGGNGYMKDYFQEKRMRDAAQARFLLGGPYLRRLDLMNDGRGNER